MGLFDQAYDLRMQIGLLTEERDSALTREKELFDTMAAMEEDQLTEKLNLDENQMTIKYRVEEHNRLTSELEASLTTQVQ